MLVVFRGSDLVFSQRSDSDPVKPHPDPQPRFEQTVKTWITLTITCTLGGRYNDIYRRAS